MKNTIAALIAAALTACTVPTGEGEGGPADTGEDECAEFCSDGPDRDAALCKACRQAPKNPARGAGDAVSPEPLPWR